MKIKIPEKEYLTFNELCERWERKPEDLHEIIKNKLLTTLLHLPGYYEIKEGDYSVDTPNFAVISKLQDVEKSSKNAISVFGFTESIAVCKGVREQGVNDYLLGESFFYKKQNYVEIWYGDEGVHKNIATYIFPLFETVSRSRVEKEGFFSIYEIKRYEEYNEAANNQPATKISLRAENNKLLLIASLYKLLAGELGWDKHPEFTKKTPLLKHIEDKAQIQGLGEQTTEKYLNEALTIFNDKYNA